MVYSNKTEVSRSKLTGSKKEAESNLCSFVCRKVGPLLSTGKGTWICLEEDAFF